jgi:hypothetical protein
MFAARRRHFNTSLVTRRPGFVRDARIAMLPGLNEWVRAKGRARAVDKTLVKTPWEGRWSDDPERRGRRLRMPRKGAWWLPAGRRPYWRGDIAARRHEFAEVARPQPRDASARAMARASGSRSKGLCSSSTADDAAVSSKVSASKVSSE